MPDIHSVDQYVKANSNPTASDIIMNVESCYRDTPFANDEERLECLFKLYEKTTGNNIKLCQI